MKRVVWAQLALVVLSACETRHDWHVRAGNAAAGRGDFVAAQTAFSRALELQPDDAHVHALLGNVWAAQGKADEAHKAWAKAVELDPNQREARVGLALQALSRKDAAQTLAQLGVPEGAEAQVLRARALLLRGSPDDVQAALTELSNLESDEALFMKGSALTVLRKFADSQAVFERLEKRNVLLARYGLARLAAAQARSTDVLIHLSAARDAAPSRWVFKTIAADPAFEFLNDSADFQALETK